MHTEIENTIDEAVACATRAPIGLRGPLVAAGELLGHGEALRRVASVGFYRDLRAVDLPRVAQLLDLPLVVVEACVAVATYYGLFSPEVGAQ